MEYFFASFYHVVVVYDRGAALTCTVKYHPRTSVKTQDVLRVEAAKPNHSPAAVVQSQNHQTKSSKLNELGVPPSICFVRTRNFAQKLKKADNFELHSVCFAMKKNIW